MDGRRQHFLSYSIRQDKLTCAEELLIVYAKHSANGFT